MELNMVEKGKKRAEARLLEENLNIWLSFSDGHMGGGPKKVETIVNKMESDTWKTFIIGSALGNDHAHIIRTYLYL